VAKITQFDLKEYRKSLEKLGEKIAKR
jgi:hypothetical protein